MQAKLKLNLDDLAVDTFDTTRPVQRQGTVFGEQCTCYTNCTCPGCPTCYASCNGTCGGTCGENTCAASCNGTCNQATCEYSCGGDCNYSLYCDTTSPARPTRIRTAPGRHAGKRDRLLHPEPAAFHSPMTD